MLTRDGNLLYVRVRGIGQIPGFHIQDDGSLTTIGEMSGVPSGTHGLAVR